jgi:hypothetical protein
MQHRYFEDISAFNSALNDDCFTAVSGRWIATSDLKADWCVGAVPLMSRKRLELVIVASLAGAASGFGAFAEEKFQRLSSGQIRAMFSGMELTDEVHWYDFYDRNGTVLSSSMGRKRTGKWWVENNQLCTDVDEDSSVRCYDVLISGNSVQLRGDGVLPLDAALRTPIVGGSS